MTFVDTNVFMYAVGREHPLRDEARAFFMEALEAGTTLVTSAEVVQELLHVYLAVGRLGTLEAAMSLLERSVAAVWPVEPDDVRLARALLSDHPGLAARDLVHLACCIRREVEEVRTFDRGLAPAFGG